MSETKVTETGSPDCPCPCKPLCAIFLIVLGLLMLGSKIRSKKDQ